MLQVVKVAKSYTTGTFTQVALDGVSLSFRDNEFVSILGPSGSGKTTLLNVIGGLDHFDGGDLVIDGISTKEYRDRDWDAYRNNRIGFVFQSYNLIPHQTILANVELALTLSGVTSAERRERAVEALGKVGLGDHVDKRPSQLSGGQMQRVAIARALINDPEILLADEPTGALDSKTSVQVMDLLREVAEDRLVIMVTHNPELAQEYSTRIVELADGRIRSDSNPFEPTEEDMREAKPPRHTSMSFMTALALSFNNLMTKKGRTLMTAFAGSIGIIGIAAILALANGVNAYIQEVEEDTLSVYPLQIMSSGFDMTSMFVDVQASGEGDAESSTPEPASNRIAETRIVTNMFSRVGKNDLASLKEYLDANGGGIDGHVQAIEYGYAVVPQIFSEVADDGSIHQVNPDQTFSALGFGGSSSSLMSSSFTPGAFGEMPGDTSLFSDQYDLLAGSWPTERDELALVLSARGTISDFLSYVMGLRDSAELERMVQQFADQEEVEAPTDKREYAVGDLTGVTFRVVPATEFYVHDEEFGVWTDKSQDTAFMREKVRGAQQLRVTCVARVKEDVDATTLSQGLYYTPKLTAWLMEQAAGSAIVREQLANPTVNVISGKTFDQEASEEGGDADLSSLFSVDASKLAGAFTMDPNALDLSSLDLASLLGSVDLSGLATSIDPSTLTMPRLDLSSIQLPSIDTEALRLDLTDIDLSGIDLESLTPDMFDMIQPALTIDASTLLDGVDLESLVDVTRLPQVIADVQALLPDYLAEQPIDFNNPVEVGGAVAAFYNDPAIRGQVEDGIRDIIAVDEQAISRIGANIAVQVDNSRALMGGRYQQLTTAQRAVVDQLIEQVGQQLSDRLARIFSADLVTTLTSALSTTVRSLLSQSFGGSLSSLTESVQSALGTAFGSVMQGVMGQLMSSMAGAMHVDEKVFAEAFSFNMDQQELAELMMALMSTERTSLDSNLAKFGYAAPEKPSEIDIYPLNFDAKAQVVSVLDAYNDRMRAAGDNDRVITYTDIVGVLMSSVTDIVNMISYVLIAFVAISLVVSSIMIGVITYISVLERKKEIGILRSIGASKREVSRVFNAETVIEGLVSGLMGVIITAVATIPANIIVEANFDVERVARLPLSAAVILVGVSVALSFVAGLMPSRKAAKADPVEALRSE